jgi:16S rRNA (adenine1518-N6/adenine1519-N6)-dimethyltransferase
MNPHSSSGPAFTAPAKKQLGQHFLADRHYIDSIVRAVNPKPGDRLVEIGPGQGAITLPLLRQHPELTVIEFDRDNISSPILFHALDHAGVVRDMHFMLQKEVVDRMAAGPGSKVFGRLSVMLQAYCEVTSLFVVPPGAFRPPPKVDSAVVRLVPRDPATIGIHDARRFAEVVKAAFGQRRKTLRNALNNVVSAEQFTAAGVRPDARAEQLEVAEFVALANAS